MNIDRAEILYGKHFEILEINIENVENQLVLSWKICFENTVFRMSFYNVSRLRVSEWSIPLELHGFEIINHSKNGWEKDSTYEIRDFEDDQLSFFCEYFSMT